MAASRTMRRLLHVLEVEEEQRRAAMETALADLRRLQAAREAAGKRERAGRYLVAASAGEADAVNRLAGLEEMQIAQRWRVALTQRVTEMEEGVNARRQEFLDKRMERRQAETLMRKSAAREAAIAGRRAQRGLDDWYLLRTRDPDHGSKA